MYILLAILIFGVLIIVHELGHFTAAKLLDVQVNEFSICMGPAIFQKKIGETNYALRCIPVGGYCAMEGEDEDTGNPRAFTAKPAWARAIILIAGAACNAVFGFLMVAILLLVSAKGFYAPVITDFEPTCPYASEEGLQVGDRIYSIDGERVYIYNDVAMLLDRNANQVYDLVVLRDGRKVTLEDFEFRKIDYVIDGQTVKRYGVTFTVEPANFGRVMKESWYTSLDFLRMTKLGLNDLFGGKVGVDQMSGPVGIVATINETGKQSETVSIAVSNIVYLGAFIAMNLAFMNLLPIPALDGGRIFALLVTALIEKLMRRRLDPKYEGYIHAAGMVLLLGFMAFVTIQDIVKLL